MFQEILITSLKYFRVFYLQSFTIQPNTQALTYLEGFPLVFVASPQLSQLHFEGTDTSCRKQNTFIVIPALGILNVSLTISYAMRWDENTKRIILKFYKNTVEIVALNTVPEIRKSIFKDPVIFLVMSEFFFVSGNVFYKNTLHYRIGWPNQDLPGGFS